MHACICMYACMISQNTRNKTTIKKKISKFLPVAFIYDDQGLPVDLYGFYLVISPLGIR